MRRDSVGRPAPFLQRKNHYPPPSTDSSASSQCSAPYKSAPPHPSIPSHSLSSRSSSLSPPPPPPQEGRKKKKMASSAPSTLAALDQRLAAAKRCSREAAMAGAKAAAVATVAAAVPTLASVRMLPWARAHLNPTGQALIISTVAGMAYFIVADKTVLSLARRHSYDEAPPHLKNTSFQGAAGPHPAFFHGRP